MKQYIDLLNHVMKNGEYKSDRTGTGTIPTFGYQMRFNLQEGFPLVTTKKMFTKGIIAELLWFLEGSTDERRLAEIQYGEDRDKLIDKKTIWTANADKQGKDLGYTNSDTIKELGPIYSKQWRNTSSLEYHDNVFFDDVDEDEECYYDDVYIVSDNIDQIKNVIESIKSNPDSRRHIVSSWNVAEIDQMALPPCHCLFQFYVNNGKLSCQLYQRSCDIFLGIPYNIASYSLLTMIIADQCNLEYGEFIHTLGDAHIYSNHIDQVKVQLKREPKELCKVKIKKENSINDYTMDSFEIINYSSHEAIKAPMAV